MVDISTLFLCIAPVLNRTLLKQLTIIAEALFCLNGRVTMLGISRWSGKGGSYRTIQRFYNSVIPWCNLQCVKNAANLAMFMVNCSQAHGRTIPLRTQFSVNDIKARFHAFFYIRALLKKTPQIEDPVFIRQLYENAESIGTIHQQLKVA